MTPRLRRAVGYWQLACGILGVALFAAYRFDIPAGTFAILDQQVGWLNYVLGCSYFSLAATAGFRLLRGTPGALRLAFLCQVPQVVSFAFLHGPHFVANAGPVVGIRVSSSYIGLTAGINTAFFLGTRVQGEPFDITLNVLAFAIALVLFRAWKLEESASLTAA